MSMTIEIAPVVAALNRLAFASHGTWLAAVGEHEKRLIEERIESTKIDPDGHHWAPWKDSTALKRQRKRNVEQGLLWDEGDLLHSITFASSLDGELEIGTDEEHAHFLQDGTRHMVAREFVGWDEKDHVWLEESLLAHVQALLA